MRAVVLMFDTLNRMMLSAYGCDWTHTPNFARLAKRCVTFDRSYVCSMPCMPARRDYLTGRPNFLHRAWGPMEPFDDSVPKMLRGAGVYSHMSTDHYHYFETGGATYHTQFNTWEFFRGQEGDPWVGQVREPEVKGKVWPEVNGPFYKGMKRQDWINRGHMKEEGEFAQSRTIAAGVEFMKRNAGEDNWLLHLETFDPHEPFYSHPKYKAFYKEHYEGYEGPQADWPPYAKSTDAPEGVVEHLRHEYASLLSMCDAKLGEVLDAMDALDMWKDTMLVVWTDHGFLLGEHERFAKCWCPYFEEVAHTPFFMHDPRTPERAGTRSDALVQPSIDLGPTLLEFFGVERTKDMFGKSLLPVIREGKGVRDLAIFGHFGGQLNVTDGRYVYMRSAAGPENQPLNEYTLMPTRMREMFFPREFDGGKLSLGGPFSFTKGCQVMKIPAREFIQTRHGASVLYDLVSDPGQERAIVDAQVEERLLAGAVGLMRELDAPAEQWERLGLGR
jgi:arylsulfatase A-like enzyme